MPAALDGRSALQLILLLTCVPIQIWLSHYNSESNRNYAVSQLVNDIHHKWLTIEPWTKWCMEFISSFYMEPHDGDSVLLEGESPAVEVFKYRDKYGFVSSQTDVRSPRPPHIKYHIGQVVRYKKTGYRGVIIGWEQTSKPPVHLHSVTPEKDVEKRSYIVYVVLVDTRDRPAPQLTYVIEDNLHVIQSKILHPLIEYYFEDYSTGRYIPRPWLQAVYPHD